MAVELETLKNYVMQATENFTARKKQERDRDYYDTKQWTAEEEAVLKKRKQPIITENLVKPKIDNLMGIERQSRTDPKAYPRTPADEGAAEAATDGIRYVLDNQDFDGIRSEVGENIFIEGEGAAIIEWKDEEIAITHIPWDRLIKDRYSRRRDGKDAKFLGMGVWMDHDDALRTYGKEHADALMPTASTEPFANEMADRPEFVWFQGTGGRERVFVVELYHDEGEWLHSVFTGSGVIFQAPSEYLDEDKKPMNPIELGVAFIDRQNNVYGPVRQLISPQDEINHRRSKMLHAITVRQTISEKGAVDDLATAKKEMNKLDGHIEVQKGFRFDRLDTGDIALGQFQLLQDSRSMMNSVGANDAVTGKDDKASSGRALQARQQAGILELGPVFDSLRSWQKRVYRQVWYRIKQFWTDERWIRVTDDENNLKFVGLNQPFTVRDQLEEAGRVIPEGFNDPRLDQVIEIRNQTAELDVDIILEDAPDTVNIQGEQFEQIVQLAAARPEMFTDEDILQASNLRNKDKILERKGGGGDLTPEQQQQKQQAEAQQQEALKIQKAGAVATVRKDASTAELNDAKTQETLQSAREKEVDTNLRLAGVL